MLERKKKGIVLVTTMLTVVLVIMLLSSVVYSNLGSFRLTTNFYDKENALMAAQSGAQYAITRLQSDILWKANPSTPYVLKTDDFEVKEEDGNVWGILSSANGKKSVFRIKFNCEDGLGGFDNMNDSSQKIESPYISTNNLFNSVPCMAYSADKSGSIQGKMVNENGKDVFKPNANAKQVTIPKGTCNLIVEGFSGPAVREASLSEPINKKSSFAQQIVEIYVSIDPNSLNVDSAISASGNINAKTGTFSLNTAEGSQAPNIRSLGHIALAGHVSAGSGTVYFNDGFTVNGAAAPNIKQEKSNSGENFAKITWADVPKATKSDTNLPAGTYVWEKNPTTKTIELRHYPTIIFYDGKPLLDSGYQTVSTGKFKGMTVDSKNLTIMFDQNVYVPGDLLIRSNINEYGTRPIVGFVNKNKGDSGTTILTSKGNITISGATMGSGAITSEGNITIQGPSLLESDPGVGVSIYSKGDVTIEPIYNTSASMEKLLPTERPEGSGPYDNVEIDPTTGAASEKDTISSTPSIGDDDNTGSDNTTNTNRELAAEKKSLEYATKYKKSGKHTVCNHCTEHSTSFCKTKGIFNPNHPDLIIQVYQAGFLKEGRKQFLNLNVECGCGFYNGSHKNDCNFMKAVKDVYEDAEDDWEDWSDDHDDDNDDDDHKNDSPTKSDQMASVDDPALSDKLVDSSKQTANYENYKREQLDTLIKRYDSIKYSDQEIAGVIYAWKNINVNIGAESRLNLTGAMVAYGREPNKDQDAQKTTDTGNINYNAKSVDLTFDPNYLNKLLDASAKRKLQIKMFANY